MSDRSQEKVKRELGYGYFEDGSSKVVLTGATGNTWFRLRREGEPKDQWNERTEKGLKCPVRLQKKHLPDQEARDYNMTDDN